MGMPIHIAAMQYSTNEKTRASNQDNIVHMLEGAALTADIVLLPANSFASLVMDQSIAHQAKPVRNAQLELVSHIAAVRNSYVSYSIIEREGDKHYATAVLVGADGRLIGKQRKTHLNECERQLGLLPGDNIEVFRTPIGKISLLMIDDLLGSGVRGLHGLDTQIILVAAEYQASSMSMSDLSSEKWEASLRTVAEHGKVCVTAANKIGGAGQGAYIGNSMVIDTSGEIQAIGSVDQEEVVCGNVILPEQGVLRTSHLSRQVA